MSQHKFNGYRRKGRKNKRGRRAGGYMSSIPKQVFVKNRQTRTIRYASNSQLTSVPVTNRCLLNLVLSIVTGQTTAVNLYEAVRIKRIDFYGTASGTSVINNYIGITWKGNRAPDTRVIGSCTPSFPAHVRTRPPRESLCGFWANNQGNLDDLLLEINCDNNVSVMMDLTIEYVIGDGTTRTCVIVDPGVSGVGYAALDNAIVAGTVGGELLQPEGLTYYNMTTPMTTREIMLRDLQQTKFESI